MAKRRSTAGRKTAPLEIRLRRQAPLSFRVLDRQGIAQQHLPLYVLEGDFFHIMRTGKYGDAHIAWRHGFRRLNVNALQHPQNEYFCYFLPPEGRTPSFRPHAEDWEEETPCGRIRIDRGSIPENVPMQLYSETGWTEDLGKGTEDPIRFPAGEGYLVVGAPFRGMRQQILDFDLKKDGLTLLKPGYTAEPKVYFEHPSEKGWSLTVEVGQHSREEVPLNKWVHVPASRHMYLELSGHGHSLTKRLLPAAEGMKISLEEEFGLSQLTLPAKASLVSTTLSFHDAVSGKPVEGKLASSEDDGKVEKLGAGRYRLTGPKGRLWLVRFESEDAPDIWVRGRHDRDGTDIGREVTRFAKLSLEAPFEYTIEHDDPLVLDRLAPGPLQPRAPHRARPPLWHPTGARSRRRAHAADYAIAPARRASPHAIAVCGASLRQHFDRRRGSGASHRCAGLRSRGTPSGRAGVDRSPRRSGSRRCRPRASAPRG